jgi:hypothetical protein
MTSAIQMVEPLMGSVVTTEDELTGWLAMEDGRPVLYFADGDMVFLEPGEPLILIASPFETARHYCGKFIQPIPRWKRLAVATVGIAFTTLLSVLVIAMMLLAAFGLA